MTDRPIKIELNCQTGEETIIPFTDEEIAQAAIDQAKYEEQKEKEKAEAQTKALAKQSAQDKLKALGLSDTEILAITGI